MSRILPSSIARLAVLFLLILAPLCTAAAPSVGAKDRRIAGTYSDRQLAETKVLTLPRTFLYDRHGALIAQESWPAELKGLQKHAGDAFCCVSETPAPPGSSGPPPGCKVVVYGTDVRESFKGLRDPSGRAIGYETLPKHKYLLVEYYATWCEPCVVGRKALDAFFDSAKGSQDYVWVSIDMSRLPEAREAAERAKPGAQ
jgi:hypothetical protein